MAGSELSTSQLRSTLAAATQAEAEARKRVDAANRMAKEAESEGAEKTKILKDQYEKQLLAQAAQNAANLEIEKARGYDSLRSIQTTYSREASRAKAEGERQAEATQSKAEMLVENSASEAKKIVAEQERKNISELEITKSHGELANAALRSDFELKNALLADKYREGLETTDKQHKQETGKKLAQYQSLSELADRQLKERYDSTLKQHDEIVNNLNARSHKQIADIQSRATNNLSSYDKRQSDPFYRIVAIQAELSETPDAVILKAKIPSHEQRNISVIIKGSQLVLSGYRRSDEKSELGLGRSRSTSSFQSFAEVFPLPSGVESKTVFRESQGDTLIIRIPKKTAPAPRAAARASDVKVRIPEPMYPRDLPSPSDSAGVVMIDNPQSESQLHDTQKTKT